MILKFGARCRSRSEVVGSLHGVAIEPAEKLVLQIIVEQPQATPLVRIKVPFGRVDSADADQVSLGMSPADFRALPQHGVEASRTVRRPVRGSTRGNAHDERVLTARTRIECRDGEVGSLGMLLADPRTGDLQGFTFAFGLQVMRDVHVGVDQIVDFRPDRIVVKFDMDELEHFPSLRA